MRNVLLVILDGWGHSNFEGEPGAGNAIERAHVPRFREIYDARPRTMLSCSGADVGLPDGQMGNSEVGHLNLGAGRVVYQDIARVDKAIAEDALADHLGLEALVTGLRERGGVLHVVGLVSDGGVHSHIRHFQATFDQLPTDIPVHVHCITDGRDTSPFGGSGYVADVDRMCARSDKWSIASVVGRYWAMDRDKRWDRTQRAYDLIARGKTDHWADDSGILDQSYVDGVTDEFVEPTGIRGIGERGIQAEDAVLFLNYRTDRMRQLPAAIAQPDFHAFPAHGAKPARVVTLTEYLPDLPAHVAFPPDNVRQGLSETLAEMGVSQLKVAETEKYAHVTYFFNGGDEAPFEREDRQLIPSPKVATYDLQPEMSAGGVADAVLEGIESSKYGFILVNFANPDMVGHTGSIPAATKAVEAVDGCLGDLLDKVSDNPEWTALVTADHGNCEKMLDEKGNVHTAHTTEPVDLILFDPSGVERLSDGAARLADVAPTVLALMGRKQPVEMTGHSLLSRDSSEVS